MMNQRQAYISHTIGMLEEYGNLMRIYADRLKALSAADGSNEKRLAGNLAKNAINRLNHQYTKLHNRMIILNITDWEQFQDIVKQEFS